jgi:hypothetical protein
MWGREGKRIDLGARRGERLLAVDQTLLSGTQGYGCGTTEELATD